jgi:hypothetical protein
MLACSARGDISLSNRNAKLTRGAPVARASKPARDFVAAVGAALVLATAPAHADLNKFEAAAGGEFGMGTAQQYGEADIKDRDFSNQVRIRVSDCSALGRRHVQA